MGRLGRLLILFLVVTMMCVLAYAADIAQPTPGALLVNDFEEFSGVVNKVTTDSPAQGPYTWWIFNDAAAGKGSTISGEIVSDAAHGSNGLKVKWLVDGWCGLGWRPTDPKISWDFSKFKTISFWVKGNGKKLRFYLEFDDANGENFWPTVIRVEGNEWTKVVIPIDQFKSRFDWQPSNTKVDKILDWPLSAIQIAPSNNKGEITIDMLEVEP